MPDQSTFQVLLIILEYLLYVYLTNIAITNVKFC